VVYAPVLAGFAADVGCSGLRLVVYVDLVADPDDHQAVVLYCHRRHWRPLVYAPDVEHLAEAQPVHRPDLLAVGVVGVADVESALYRSAARTDQ
jgi:hypothetical protein